VNIAEAWPRSAGRRRLRGGAWPTADPHSSLIPFTSIRSKFLHDGAGRGTLGAPADAALELGLELLFADIKQSASSTASAQQELTDARLARALEHITWAARRMTAIDLARPALLAAGWRDLRGTC
jgi:hypothetical protein